MARGRRTAEATEAQTAQENETMSDVNTENPDTIEGTEAEAGTEASGHVFNQGDEATVIRGKLRGRKGSILKHNATAGTYAVELEDGTLVVVNAGNLKAPVDSTVSVRALVNALTGFGQAEGSPDRDAVIRLAAMLDEVAPGPSVKLNEAFSA